MRTFSQSLTITKNMKLAEEAFKLMILNGISPVKFVEWYCEDGIIHQHHGYLISEAENWIKKEVRINEMSFWPAVGTGAIGGGLAGAAVGALGGPLTAGAGAILGGLGGAMAHKDGISGGLDSIKKKYDALKAQYPDQTNNAQANNAHKSVLELQQALEELSKRHQSSQSLQQQIGDPKFSQTLMHVISMLKNKSYTTDPEGADFWKDLHAVPSSKNTAPAAPAAAPTPAAAPAPPKLPTGPRPNKNATTPALPVDSKLPSGITFNRVESNANGMNPYIYNEFQIKNKITNYKEIRKCLQEMANHGINPEYVFDIYLKERFDENFLSSISGFIGRQAGNIGGWMRTGQWGAGNQQVMIKSQQEDAALIAKVKNKIDILNKFFKDSGQTFDAEFLNYMKDLQKHLGIEPLPAPAAPAAPATPEQKPAQAGEKPAAPAGEQQPAPVQNNDEKYNRPVEKKANDRIQKEVYGQSGNGSDGDFKKFKEPEKAKEFFMANFSGKPADHLKFARFLREFGHTEQDFKESRRSNKAMNESKKENDKFLESILGRYSDKKKTWLN